MKQVSIAAAAALLLAACGGGGGGGTETLTVEPAQMSFAAPAAGPTPFGQTVRGTVSNLDSNVFMDFSFTTNGLFTVNGPDFDEPNSGFGVVLPKEVAALGPGRYEDTITVRVCRDNFCQRHISGSPKVVPVTYVIGLAPTPKALSFTAVETLTPADQNLELELYSGSAAWTSAIDYAEGADWLELSQDAGGTLPATVQAGVSPLAAGVYHATIELSGGGETSQVPVTYTVTHLLRTTALTPFTITNASGVPARTKVVTVSSGDPTRTIAWSSESDASWLTATASGDTAAQNQLTLTLADEPFLALHNGAHVAHVTLSSASPDVTPLVLTVTLNRDISQVDYIAPYLGYVGQGGEFILRGKRFSERMPSAVEIGGVEVEFTYVGNTEVRATVPALPAGRHAVRLLSAAGVVGSSAELVVIDPPRFAPAPMNPARNTDCLELVLFDAERATMYLNQTAQTGGGSCRYRHTGTEWLKESMPVSDIHDVALTPDGRELLILEQDAITHADPLTLEVLARTPYPTDLYPYYFAQVSMANNGVAVITAAASWLYYYDVLARTFVQTTYSVPSLVRLSASANGARMIIGGNAFSPVPVWAYDASTGVASNTGLVRNTQFSLLSRDGSRALLRGTPSGNTPTETLIDASNAVLGQMPDAASYIHVLSPDGMLAARQPGISDPVGEIKLFDLDAPNGSGFYEARPDLLMLTDTDDTYTPPIGMTPDGGALIILGDKNLWTEDIPPP